MSPLEAALLVATLAVMINFAITRALDQLDDPAYLRTQGVIIVADNVIEARSGAIGEYRGGTIWESVTFKGMQYRFNRVLAYADRERIGAGELYLEPGLVYALK